MRVATWDPSKLEQVVGAFDALYRHRVEHPRDKTDELYYKIYGQYIGSILHAHDEGKLLVGHTAYMPQELIYAMDMVPCHLESVPSAIASLCNLWEEGLATAKAYGIAPEVCSIHRHTTACVLNGWLPRPDAMLWSNFDCDNTAKGGEHAVRLWNTPRYYLDRGYDTTDRERRYFLREMEGAVAFLEGIAGRKMDWDRLVEAATHAREVMLLQREIEELRKNVPSPLRGRATMYMHGLNMFVGGTAEAVAFFRQMRDEAKARVAQHEGFLKEEKYRLAMFFGPPQYGWKLLDWMERAHGAVIVADPIYCHFGPGDFNPSKPLEALVGRIFLRPAIRQLLGPIEPLVEDMLIGAREHTVDG